MTQEIIKESIPVMIGKSEHPQVPGFPDDPFSETARVLCPYCGLIHTHGRSPGNRVPHCWGKQNLPEYCITLVDILLPDEGLKIHREAKRLHKILRSRRSASCRNKLPKKPDLAYEQEIADLAVAARELNCRVLAGEPLEE